ncbi:hypothetical protein Ddye_024061 [Dipteronia dyeriana]|uniref:Uncharacterized protein n=1 Tax=Dipteronia dyeriana TaxID=168575 RepID=A0AAD9TUQ8_9ROSI|nr:hypothetical protein Ddye_024061 [Dipteronia dyeriana]
MTMHLPMKFSGGVIHQLLLRELYHNRPDDEIWFMLETYKVRLSKVEFCLITGLQFRVVPDTTWYRSEDNGIHRRYFTVTKLVPTPTKRDEPYYAYLVEALPELDSVRGTSVVPSDIEDLEAKFNGWRPHTQSKGSEPEFGGGRH